MEPITREEVFLTAAGGQNVVELTPVTRKEMFLAKAAGRSVDVLTPITREEFFINQIQGGGGGGSALPAVTSADNGKVLSVVDGAWAADEKRFVVTLTPTAADFSGTMDKTTKEIDEAWNAGKRIFFTVIADEFTYTAPVMLRGNTENLLVFYTYLMMGSTLVVINTVPVSADSHYNVKQYQLTPMGS